MKNIGSVVRRKILFIYNPRAGKTHIRNNLFEIIDIFTKAGFEVTAYPTQRPGDAINAVRDRNDIFELLICSGGDGTLDEVVTGMMQCKKRIPIGYVPAGSTNDFANSLTIPKNMMKAANIIVKEKYFACDVGKFNDDVFVYIAAFGLFTDISYETNQQVKNLLGHMAYIMEGMKRLSTIKAYAMKIKVNDIIIEDEFMYGMITNSTSVGGFKKMTGKWVKLDDGLFEVTLIKRPRNPVEINNILSALLGKNINKDYMYCFKTAHLEIESEEGISWTLDGEYGGKLKKVTIENKQQAIEIIVP